MEIHQVSKAILNRIGLHSEAEMEAFLNPSYADGLYDPFLMKGVTESVVRILDAVVGDEKMCVYSDYDCDGIPGGTLLREMFSHLGRDDVIIYIPNRNTEGYGIHDHALLELAGKGVTFMITVDLGITNLEQALHAKRLGIDLIITDHHLPIATADGKTISPEAFAVVNPKQWDCSYPDPMLCGTGVAFKLVTAVFAYLKLTNEPRYLDLKSSFLLKQDGIEKWMLDLVGISTIADMVPLQKENRVLAIFGLKVLRKSRRPGIRILFERSKLNIEYATEEDVSFSIAPRVNAASRMGEPKLAHDFLYAKNSNDALACYETLDGINNIRKTTVKESVKSVDVSAFENEDVILTGDPSWNPGILGLIAQQILDATGKPTFVFGACVNGEYKGSCRAKEGHINVVTLMHASSKYLGHFGGHEAAGGFSMKEGKESLLRKSLNKNLACALIPDDSSKIDLYDIDAKLDDIGIEMYEAVAVCGPFGVGNPRPVFVFTGVTAFSFREFGKTNEHLEVSYKIGRRSVKAIKFFAGKDLIEKVKKQHDLRACIERNNWGGGSEIRLKIVDFVV